MRSAALLLAGLCAACGPASHEMPEPAPPPKIAPVPASVTLGVTDPKAERVSMVRVLADPASLNNRPVVVVGYLDLAFESNHFCLHKEDADALLITNCVSISVPNSPEVLALNRRYVAVWGTVAVGISGHLGLFNLSIQDVREIVPALSKAEIMSAGQDQ